tara:strand:- start:331 stop:492 length:162 start_codon:yes stop_codon:yes gene_type:complete
MKNTIELQNEAYYGLENFVLVEQGELTGTFNIVMKGFDYTIVSDEDGQYTIKL